MAATKTTTVKAGAGRPAAAAKRTRAAQRTPLPGDAPTKPAPARKPRTAPSNLQGGKTVHAGMWVQTGDGSTWGLFTLCPQGRAKVDGSWTKTTSVVTCGNCKRTQAHRAASPVPQPKIEDALPAPDRDPSATTVKVARARAAAKAAPAPAAKSNGASTRGRAITPEFGEQVKALRMAGVTWKECAAQLNVAWPDGGILGRAVKLVNGGRQQVEGARTTVRGGRATGPAPAPAQRATRPQDGAAPVRAPKAGRLPWKVKGAERDLADMSISDLTAYLSEALSWMKVTWHNSKSGKPEQAIVAGTVEAKYPGNSDSERVIVNFTTLDESSQKDRIAGPSRSCYLDAILDVRAR
jgi:hypothetical protein